MANGGQFNWYIHWYPIEIKSGRSSGTNARAKRQAEASKLQFDYILNDAILQIPGTDVKRSRVEPLSKIKDHRKAFNKLLGEAKQTGNAGKMVETGLYYTVNYTQRPDQDIFKQLHQPIGLMLNAHKYDNSLYYPLLMLFDSSEHYMDFIRGEVVITIFFEISILCRYAREMNYSFTPQPDKNGAYHFIPDDPARVSFHASSFAIGKIFFQLYSPKWWLKESILSLNAKYPYQATPNL